MKRFYVVVGIDVPEGLDNEEIDEVVHEMSYVFNHTQIKDTEIVESQYPYGG